MLPTGQNDREQSSTGGFADRREALVLFAATAAVGSIGLGAGGAAGALLGAEIAGTEAAAGLPLGVLALGSAASALAISRSALANSNWPSLLFFLVTKISSMRADERKAI